MRRGLILTLLLSCSAPRPVAHCQLDPDFSAQDVNQISLAARQWNGVLRVPMRLDGGPWRILAAVPPTPGVAEQTDAKLHVVYITPGMAPEQTLCSSLHGFGHVNGLDHQWGPNDVMNPWSGATEFTAADMKECRRVGSCD